MSINLTRRDALKGIATITILPLVPAWAFAPPGDRRGVAISNFDDDWLFLRGDAAGAQESGFDASGWRKVDLPHDWSIEDLPTQLQPAALMPSGRTAIAPKRPALSAG